MVDIRYIAKEVNGKGYIFDSEFSQTVPVYVETTIEYAKQRALEFNARENPNILITPIVKAKLREAAIAVCGKAYLLYTGEIVTKNSKQWQTMSKMARLYNLAGVYDINTHQLKMI